MDLKLAGFLGLVLSMATMNSAFSDGSQFKQNCAAHIAAVRTLLTQIKSVNGGHDEANTLKPYNQMGIHLDAAENLAGLLRSVHPDESIRNAAEECEKDLSELRTELSLDRGLFDAFAAMDISKLDAISKRLIEKTLRDFKRSGVDKDEATRNRIRQINQELVEIGQEFDRNISKDTRFIELDSAQELEGLPQDYIDAHKPGENGKIKITTQYPDSVPFMTYAKSGEARKRLAFVSKNRAYPQNETVFKKLLEKRYELAKLLGYDNWAAFVTEDKMIKTEGAAAKFIDEVAVIARPRGEREHAMLLAAKQKDVPGATVVDSWEAGYYEEQVKLNQFAFDSKEARQYFEFNRVKKGLLDLTSELFEIQYIPVPNPIVWHESVEVYDVKDSASGKHIGRIYLDLHPRENKYNHAAQFSVVSGVEGVQIPEGALVCNFPNPKESSGPALMQHGDVVTFFHEFGHLLHHVLGGHQKWIRFSGVATEWDFVEAPSQFFEEWAWDPKVLQRFATHIQNGRPIPEDLVRRMKAAEEFGEGLAASTQMFYASLSLGYHNQDPSRFDLSQYMQEKQSRYSLFPYQEGTHFYSSFGHLNGYSAVYYTYMWSQVIAKDLLSAFGDGGMMNKPLALKYRKTVLEGGGSKDAADLTKDFLGRPYSFESFRKWLNGGSGSGEAESCPELLGAPAAKI